MKSKFFAILVAVMLISGSLCAVANTQPEVILSDGVNGIIQINGTADAGELVNVLVLNPGRTLAEVATDVTAIQYQNEIYADRNGSFSLNVALNIPSDYIDGTFDVYLMAESWGQIYKKPDGIYFLLINERVLLDSFKQGKENIVLGADGEILYQDVIGLDEIDSDDITIYRLYKEAITTEGVKSVGTSLLGTEAVDFEAFYKEFAKEVIVAAITSNVLNGYDHIEDVLTEANCTYVGIDASDYLDLDDDEKQKANAYIMEKASSLTVDNIDDIIEDAVDEATYVEKKPSGNSNGGGYRSPVIVDSSYNDAPTLVPQTKNVFSDIEGIDWAKDAINALYNKNVIDGVGNGMFAPYDSLTREQAVKLICQFYGISVDDAVSEISFTDVDNNAWYTPYINAAVKNNIVQGMGDGRFGVGEFITREDFAVLIHRVSAISAPEREAAYTDKDQVADYAISAVNALYNAGAITGYDDGSFRPKANISRAEACVILARMK